MKKDGSPDGIDDDDAPSKHDSSNKVGPNAGGDPKDPSYRPAFSANPSFQGSSSSLNVKDANGNSAMVSWEQRSTQLLQGSQKKVCVWLGGWASRLS
jgi:hypothetical protein